jgi:hypothetical protein
VAADGAPAQAASTPSSSAAGPNWLALDWPEYPRLLASTSALPAALLLRCRTKLAGLGLAGVS